MTRTVCAHAEALSWPPSDAEMQRLQELQQALGKVLEEAGIGQARGDVEPNPAPGQHPTLCFEVSAGARGADLVRSHLQEEEPGYRWNVVSG